MYYTTPDQAARPLFPLPTQSALTAIPSLPGNMLREQIAALEFKQQAGTRLYLEPGYYATGRRTLEHRMAMRVCGHSRDTTRIDLSCDSYGAGGPVPSTPAIMLANNVWYEDLELRLSIAKNLEGELFGFGSGQAGGAGNCTAGAINCRLVGGVWCAYIWSGHNNNLRFHRCQLSAAKRVVMTGTSSGPEAASARLYDCDVLADDSIATAGGAVGPYSIGLVSRAGPIHMHGGTITVIGSDPATTDPAKINEFISGAWCDFEGHPAARVYLYGVTVNLIPKAAKEFYHIVHGCGKVVYDETCVFQVNGVTVKQPIVCPGEMWAKKDPTAPH